MKPLLVLVALAALASCKSSDSITTDREQALALVAQFAPQLRAHGASIDGLMTRLRALPAGTAGADAVIATLDRDRASIAALQAVIDQVPARVADAFAHRRRAALAALTDDTAEQVSAGLITISNDVADATLAVGALEATAAAATTDAGVTPLDAGIRDAR